MVTSIKKRWSSGLGTALSSCWGQCTSCGGHGPVACWLQDPGYQVTDTCQNASSSRDSTVAPPPTHTQWAGFLQVPGPPVLYLHSSPMKPDQRRKGDGNIPANGGQRNFESPRSPLRPLRLQDSPIAQSWIQDQKIPTMGPSKAGQSKIPRKPEEGARKGEEAGRGPGLGGAG